MQTRHKGNVIAIGVALIVLVAGAVMIYLRGGILAWLGLMVGTGLLLLLWFRPSKKDLLLSLTISIFWALLWPAIFYYVILTWESGEVVELTIDTSEGDHVVRTWVLEEPGALKFYYDAPAPAAKALISGANLTIMRGGKPLAFDSYTVHQADEMPQEKVNQVLELMAVQYGDANDATDIFYGFLGRARDRVGIVVEIPRESIAR